MCPRSHRPIAGILLAMDRNGTTLKHLSRDECMRLMASVPVGRIVYTRQALPAVEVVKHFIKITPVIVNGRRLATGRTPLAARTYAGG